MFYVVFIFVIGLINFVTSVHASVIGLVSNYEINILKYIQTM